jgi:hypothetical protein
MTGNATASCAATRFGHSGFITKIYLISDDERLRLKQFRKYSKTTGRTNATSDGYVLGGGNILPN